jgi:hypothetical protein
VAAVAAACPKAAGAAKPKTAIIEDMASNVVFIVVICEPDEDPWPKTVGAQTMAPVQILPVQLRKELPTDSRRRLWRGVRVSARKKNDEI